MLQRNCRIRSLTRTIGGLCFWSKRFKICVNPADSVERRVEPVDSCGHIVSLCTSCTNDKLSKDGRQERCQRMKNDQIHFFLLPRLQLRAKRKKLAKQLLRRSLRELGLTSNYDHVLCLPTDPTSARRQKHVGLELAS